ncbi:TonB-dependent receptor [Acinetobacter qingfengensis]|uniref:TonB-dependent receptor n=1 Tax=Acinetobacter qingfengensis TaxID=1262585 RepID=A0A1E7R5C6_9GAMM|nr:TonB-dependent receptor [Acinetobacter qingfengensis]KAA8730916.1 TonB-dependent receptor [Acinetobacter qingfengensis]OEY94485.1 TonB-dependent receptor [Acinetobacter qingfengensis]
MHQTKATQQFKLKYTVLTLSLMMTSLSYAQTQSSADDAVALAPIYVQSVGDTTNIDEALKEQKATDQISSVVHADAIGQLPDDNAAEALQRIPGVSTERDQGEGRFVTVRGLGADLNSVSINGTLVPAPESDRRGVALDVLPSGLIQSLSVVKTLTPDMDANALGGSVQIQSMSAFDHEGLFYTGNVEGSYDDKREKYSPKLSGAISNRFSIGDGEDNFGVAAAVSYQKRKFGSDNVETGGSWDGDALEETSMRQYDITRERLGVGLNMDYRPTENSQYYLRTLFSRFKDNEVRNAVKTEFSDALLPSETGAAEITRALKAREETQEIQSYVLGTKHEFDVWTIEGQVGYSEASEKNPKGIAAANYVGEFDNVGYNSRSKPVIFGGSDIYDASQYTLDKIEQESSLAKDKEKNIKFDLTRHFSLANYPAELKFGAKLSQREKTNNTDVWVYKDFDSSNGLSGTGHYDLAKFGPVISTGAVYNYLSGLNADDYLDMEESTINDFKTNEDIRSAYFMQTIDFDKLRLIAGLRYEDTHFKTQGYEFKDEQISTTKFKNNYDHWLPGVLVRYELSDDAVLRAGWTNTVVRPTFAQSSPGIYIDTSDLEAEFGNPNLKPLEAQNFDFGVERYFGRASVISFNAFYKDIKNFIYNTDIAGTGEWADYSEAITYKNGEKAKLYGVELAYSQKFDQLPAPWNGLLIGLNTTFSRSEANISGTKDGVYSQRKINLPNQSKLVGNALLGWENEKFGFKVSANYKSSYLYELSAIDTPEKDIYSDEQLFVDFSSHFNIRPNLQLRFDVQNITNEHYYTYMGRQQLNAQYEEYGPTFKLSLNFHNF